MPDTPRLLLLDGHSLAYRAFFALPVENFATTTGQPTNAVYGFTSMLINLLRDEQPTHLAVAFDLSRRSFRTTEYPEYKANRSESPTDFKGQVSLIQEVLDALDVPYVTYPDYEADDVIATLVTQAEAAGMDVLVCSGDRDALQLVTDRTTVLYPRKGVSDLARMTPAAVQEKYGVPPHQYPDLAAIVGETSDNLPGVPGVGPGFASKWIQQYGSLEEIVANADKITGKKGEALRANLADVLRNRRLNRLVRELDLPLAPADAARRPWDRDAVARVFDALEFRVLRDRLYSTLTTAEPEAEAGFELAGRPLATGELGAWLAEYTAEGERVGLAVEGSWGRGTGEVTALGFATRSGVGAWIDPVQLDADDEIALVEFLGDPGRPKALHDVKG
ncbi:MAG TPA: 5'-3' exonuclease H3TH domain-containing protein, partial [Mycobacteriales bacterium]